MLIASTRHGYDIFRDDYVARVGVSVERMDEPFAAISERVLKGFVEGAAEDDWNDPEDTKR